MTSIGPCIVIHCYIKTNQMHKCIKFILFWSNIPHVSDGLSVHRKEFKTVHTATKQTLLSVWHTPVAVCTVLNSWWRTERPYRTCSVTSKWNKFGKFVASSWFYYRNNPTGLTFNNCTLCPHYIYVFCIYLRTNSDLCQHKLIGFITEMKSVYSAVRTGFLNKTVCASASSLNG